MSYAFRPAVARGTTVVEFPRPVPTLRLQESWHNERFKVPLRDGDTLVGHSRNGVDIILQGQVGSHEGTLQLDEQAMLDTLATLRAALHVDADHGKYRLLLYWDEATDTARHFRDCSTVRLEIDLSDEHLFTYAATIHADDPVLYATPLTE